MATFQPRERRLLFVAAIVAAVVLGYMYGVEPLAARHERVQALITGREALLARQERLVARRARHTEERDALQAEIARRRTRLLAGDKPPLAASELQKLVKSMAQEAGVDVRSERILPTVEHGGYTEVPVEVTLSGPIRGMVAFLQRLDAAPVQVSVQDLKLRVVSITAPRELLATVAVTGYIAAAGSADAEPRGRSEPRRAPGT